MVQSNMRRNECSNFRRIRDSVRDIYTYRGYMFFNYLLSNGNFLAIFLKKAFSLTILRKSQDILTIWTRLLTTKENFQENISSLKAYMG